MITLPTARPLIPAAVTAHFDAQHAELVAEISALLVDAEAAVDAGNVVLAAEIMDAVRDAESDRDAIEALWTS